MRDLKKKDKLVEAAGDAYGKTLTLLPLDVCSDESVKQCINSVKERHVDILSEWSMCESRPLIPFLSLNYCYFGFWTYYNSYWIAAVKCPGIFLGAKNDQWFSFNTITVFYFYKSQIRECTIIYTPAITSYLNVFMVLFSHFDLAYRQSWLCSQRFPSPIPKIKQTSKTLLILHSRFNEPLLILQSIFIFILGAQNR